MSPETADKMLDILLSDDEQSRRRFLKHLIDRGVGMDKLEQVLADAVAVKGNHGWKRQARNFWRAAMGSVGSSEHCD